MRPFFFHFLCLVGIQLSQANLVNAQKGIPKSFQIVPKTSGYRFDFAGNYQPVRTRSLRHIYESEIVEVLRAESTQETLELTKPQKERLTSAVQKYDAAFTVVKDALKKRTHSEDLDREFLKKVADFNDDMSGLLSDVQRGKLNDLIARRQIIESGPLQVSRNGTKLHLAAKAAESFEEIKPSKKLVTVASTKLAEDAAAFLKNYDRKSIRITKQLIEDLSSGLPETTKKSIAGAFRVDSWSCYNLTLLGSRFDSKSSDKQNSKLNASWLQPSTILKLSSSADFEIQSRSGLRSLPLPSFYILSQRQILKKIKLEVTDEQVKDLGPQFTRYVNLRNELVRAFTQSKTDTEREDVLRKLKDAGHVLNRAAESVLLEPQLESIRVFSTRYHAIRYGMQSAIRMVLSRDHEKGKLNQMFAKLDQNREKARENLFTNLEKVEKEYVDWFKQFSDSKVLRYLESRPEKSWPQVDLLLNEMVEASSAAKGNAAIKRR